MIRNFSRPAFIWASLIAVGYLWVAGSELQCSYLRGNADGCDPRSLAYFLFPNEIVPLLADMGFGRLAQFLTLGAVDAALIAILLKFFKRSSRSLPASVAAIIGFLVLSLIFGILTTYLYFSHMF